METDGVDRRFRNGHREDEADAVRHIGLDHRLLLGLLPGGFDFEGGDQVGGKSRIEFGAVDVDQPPAIQARTGGDLEAIGRVGDAEDASLHRGIAPQQVGVVPDLPARLAEDPVDLRHAVGTAHQHLVLERMPRHRLQPATQGTGRDGRDVVDEPLRRRLGQLGRHVAAHGDDVAAVRAEDGVEHPVVVRTLLENLFPRRRLDGPQRVVRAAERNQPAIGRPADAVDRVERRGHRDEQLAAGHVPHLDLARP